MVQLNPVNVVRMGLLGGIESSAAAIAEGRFGNAVDQPCHNIKTALQHLEAIGLGGSAVISQQLTALRKTGPLSSLIDTYQIRNSAAPSIDAEDYTSANHPELMGLIGALYMIDTETLQQNIKTIAEISTPGSEGIGAEDKALQLLHASLQLNSAFRDPRSLRDVEEADEPYQDILRQQAWLREAFKTRPLF